MAAQWEPERVVDEALATDLIASQFPELGPLTLESYGAGWDNTVFRVNGDWVFRFPRRAIAAPLLGHEERALPRVATAVPCAVPSPAFVGRPTERYPWPFLGSTHLPGRTACRVAPDHGARLELAGALGRFLKGLHGPSLGTGFGLPGDAIGRMDLRARTPRVREKLAQARSLGLVADTGPFEALLDEDEPRLDPGAVCLVHGDLYARHLLLDGENRLVGVIDWGDVHLGHPAVDLSVAHTFLPPDAHPAFRAAYGDIAPDVWRAARRRGLESALTCLLYARDLGDVDLGREARLGLDHLR